ncbi:uncharacterized protein LOC132876111 [Neoarius graeffei]|uniref:uncharacterized protein LOC132876111 n=1 Tax=Neoarius graeffei TaxID=443677 RepID=UPI00298C43EA|nr:uncharacterized protein LOC132876111 [Neoarius graeffei]
MQQKCRDMKQLETGLHWATGVLILMLWLQGSLRVAEAAHIQNQSDGQDIQACVQTVHQPRTNNRHVRNSVHLQPVKTNGVAPISHSDAIFIWELHHSTKSIFKLEDNSKSLVVPKKGLYFVNLKMYYYIPTGHACKDNLNLSTRVQLHHSSYPVWIDVIKGTDTMQCVVHWRQSFTLSQVVKLEKGTKLRVIIDPSNYGYVIKDVSTYFTVTLL